MALERILEAEVMDSDEEAADYDAMDHAEVNRVFVVDLLAAIQGSGRYSGGSTRGVQGSGTTTDSRSTALGVLGTQYSVPSTESSADAYSQIDVLDLGTGTALIPIELCRRHSACRVVAADAAVSMLELARYNIEVNGLVGRIELAHVDAKGLPFQDAKFDVVMSNSIIHHIPEPIHVLREAVRVTKNGGLLFFRDLLRPETEDELRRLVATYTAGANEHQQRMFAESLHAALSLEEIRGLVSSLEFSSDGVRQSSDRHWTWVGRRSSL